MFKKIRLKLPSLALVLLCAACSNGSSDSVTSSTSPATSDKSLGLVSLGENVNAFTVVVGPPYVLSGGTPIYTQLYKDLTQPERQAKVPISRILLAIENPGTTSNLINSVFRIGDSFNIKDTNNGQVIGFLKELSDYNANATTPIEVYAYPDVEISSQWETWQVPSQGPTDIPSCNASKTEADLSKKAMLHSICWVSMVNRLIGASKPTITGVAYDNQSNYLAAMHPKDLSPTGWTYPYAHGDKTNGIGLNLGWISAGGIAKGSADIVDLNLIEVYDLISNKGPYFDTLADSSLYKVLPPNPISVCSAASCAYEIGIGSLPFFPGYQYKDPSQTIPAVGANSYQCAISMSPADLAVNGCNDAYKNNIDLMATPDIRLLQSLNYIKFNLSPKPTPRTSALGPIYQNVNGLYGTVVYLLSTQYAGPVGAYYSKDKNTGIVTSSNSLCIDSGNTQLCSCLASQYNKYASCGDENGFGTWGAHLTDFKNFVFGAGGFMDTQGGKNCSGASCSPGIYMYDFIPQAWYK